MPLFEDPSDGGRLIKWLAVLVLWRWVGMKCMRHCGLVPSYSPKLNPDEQLKANLKKALGARV